MPTTVTYPGVYIEEVPSGVRTITGVATSITAFVGTATRGPTQHPIKCNSFADFTRRFGGLAFQHPLGYAVSHFFSNGGTDAIIVRVPWTGATKSTLTLDTADNKTLVLEALGEGEWGNDLRAVVNHETVDPHQKDLFNLTIIDTRGYVESFKHVVETFRNVSVKQEHPRFIGNVLEESSLLARLRTEDAHLWPKSHPLAKLPDWYDDNYVNVYHQRLTGGKEAANGAVAVAAKVVLDVPSFDPLTLEAAVAGDAGNEIKVRVEWIKRDGDASQYALIIKKGADVEVRKDVSTATDSLKNALNGTLLKLPDNATSPPFRPKAHRTPTQEHTPGLNGSDGVPPTDDAILLGDEAAKTGIYALDRTDLFNLLCLPPFIRGAANSAETYQKALVYCLDKRAFLIVDPSDEWKDVTSAQKQVENLRGTLGHADSKNAAVFFPRLKMADPLLENRTAEFAPCGAIAGIMSRTDGSRGVWKAPAGIEASIAGMREFTFKMTDAENGDLNPLGVNCLRNFPVYGNVVWGSRTLAGADQLASEWKYIPIRRFTLFLEESLYRGTQWVVFEPNDEPLWAQIRLNVGAFMQGLFRKGAFQGASAREAYFVKCDSTTTTQNDINLGIVNIEVGFAPLKPAEFVVIKIQQIAGDIAT